jgi:prepilin-type N-terminal cleavage/methylation domain-containing protein
MHIHHNDFDRTFFKTHKSRSAKITLDKTMGFTLIELLVVISIIALLSTVVLAAISDARVKARNTAKNSLVLEYVKALELYKSDNNGLYPSAGTGEEILPRCIGYAETENCRVTLSKIGDNQINSAFNLFIAGPPASRTSITNGATTFQGVTYNCKDTTCTSYVLDWVTETNNAQCFGNATTNNSYGNNTRCTYDSSLN